MSDAEAVPGTASAGVLIRAERERQGLHIAALAAAIKVAPRKLDALENDRWSELPDATFTRALAQTVCRTLKMDARPVLDRLPAAGPAALDPLTTTLQTPFRDRAARDTPVLSASAIRPLVWAGAVLMLAAVAVYFMPDGLLSGRPAAPAASSPAVAAPAPLAPASAAEGLFPPAEPGASAAEPAASMSTVSVDLPEPAAASAPPLAVQGAVPGGAASAAAASTATNPTALAQLSSTAPTWVEARDARGTVLLSRTVAPGEKVGIDGALPIRLTIGNATATQLVFRGQRVDLAAGTRDNVARVELR